MRLFFLAPLGFALLAGCFKVEPEPGQYRCDRPTDVCPDLYVCIAGLCQPRSDRDGLSDDRIVPQKDLASPKVACTNQGVRLATTANGREIYGCPGTFGNSQAKNLCKAGFHLCGTEAGDEELLLSLSGQGRCGSVPGFYIASVPATLSTEGRGVCGTSGQRPALIGCGKSRPDGIQDDGTCKGLTQWIPCDRNFEGWRCSAGAGDAAHDLVDGMALGGVLCCE